MCCCEVQQACNVQINNLYKSRTWKATAIARTALPTGVSLGMQYTDQQCGEAGGRGCSRCAVLLGISDRSQRGLLPDRCHGRTNTGESASDF